MYNHCTEGGKYEGRCTAPLLVDLQTGRIISNESGDIVRMLNSFPLYLPISPNISQYLPISPYLSLYLPDQVRMLNSFPRDGGLGR